MRKIILNLALSLEGYIEGSGGEFDWCFTDQDYGFSAFMARIDTLVMGRKSYELMISMEEDSFADKRRIVVSQSLKNVEKGWELLEGEMEDAIGKLRETGGKDIWLFGGAELANAFLRADLVDELMLAVHPLLLGGGKPLFGDLPDRKYFKLLEARSYDSGMVILHYEKTEAPNP